MLSPVRTSAAYGERRYGAVLAVALLAFPFVACERVDIVAERTDGALGAADAKSEASGADSEPGDANSEASGYDADTCGIQAERVGDTVCSQSGARYFRHALCVCENYSVNSLDNVSGPQLKTDSFDSSSGDLTPRCSEGSVGINNKLSVNGELELQVCGSLFVAGTNDPGIWLSNGAKLSTGKDLDVQAAVRGGEAAVVVAANAQVGGDIQLGSLTVMGTLTTPGAVDPSYNIGGTIPVRVPVSAPCACNAQDLGKAISSLVADHASEQQRAGGLGNYADGRTESFSCGKYYLPDLSGSGTLKIEITGRVALYVAAQMVNFNGPVIVELKGTGAELDLFLAGSLVAYKSVTFGSATDAGRVRLYVGGSVVNLFEGEHLFAGHIYAPNATLTLKGPTEVFGSVFVKEVSPSNAIKIHYDSNSRYAGGSECDN